MAAGILVVELTLIEVTSWDVLRESCDWRAEAQGSRRLSVKPPDGLAPAVTLAACHHDDAGLRSEPLATEQEVLLHADHWCRVTGSRGEAGGGISL